MSNKFSTDPERKIIDEFAKEIKTKRNKGSKPEKAVIAFRNDEIHGIERQIWDVPINILRFRKYNGRIASDIESYEMLNGILDEESLGTQDIIREILKKKDEEANVSLSNLIEHSGQKEPAIITCDGFLINGNRRKMTIEALYEKTKDRKFETMKVVILPGKGNEEEDEGGPPTLKEIEQIENSYQLQSDGKSEYTNFDKSISIRKKIRAGMSLEEQLRADPSLVSYTEKEFKNELKKYQNLFLGPLECADRYLEQFEKPKLYENISEGRNDREGRWQSFIDYYSFHKQLRNDEGELTKYATDLGIEDDETGDIENIAFKIIRKKEFDDYKTHEVIRKLSKMLGNKEAKKALMKIKNVPDKLSKDDYNADDDLKTIDKKWGSKNKEVIFKGVNTALRILNYDKERETPMSLLEDSLKKLNHESMDLAAILLEKIPEAMKLARNISKRANDIEHELYHLEKESKQKLKNKNSSK